MTYKRARQDFEALERISELSDQVWLDEGREHLMQNPTKSTAMSMYQSGIRLWFRQHGHENQTDKIAKRHNII